MAKLLFAVAMVIGLLAPASSARAAFIFTDGTFFTAPADGQLIFTFQGFSAAFTDSMNFTFDGTVIFTNQTTPVGTVVVKNVIAGQVYQLSIVTSADDTWFSDPADNSDGLAHLAATDSFADFGIGAPAFPISSNCALAPTCYLGWEDLPPQSDSDFNDLVFSLQFAAVPEPTSLALFMSGLLGFVAIRRFARLKFRTAASP